MGQRTQWSEAWTGTHAFWKDYVAISRKVKSGDVTQWLIQHIPSSKSLQRTSPPPPSAAALMNDAALRQMIGVVEGRGDDAPSWI